MTTITSEQTRLDEAIVLYHDNACSLGCAAELVSITHRDLLNAL